jgi:hypothetical protein
MVNSLHTQANREKIISQQQSSSDPLPLRKSLNIAFYAAMNKIANAERSNLRGMLARGKAEKAEIAEQLRILKNITAEAQQEWLEDGNEVEVAK